MARRRLGAALATGSSLVLAASASAGAAGLPKVPTSDNPAPAAQLRVEPAEIVFGGDGSHFLGGTSVRGRIHWSRWDAFGASGIGDYWITSPTGPAHGSAVTITMTRPATFHGQRVFTTLTYHFDQPNPDFKRTQVFPIQYLPGKASYDGFYWE